MENPQISTALPVCLPSLAELFRDVPEVRGAGGVWDGVVNSTLVQFPRWLVGEDTQDRRTDRHRAARLRLHRIPQAHAWPLAFRAAPALGIELLWKEKREFWSSAKTAGRSFVVVFVLLSSGRAITHLVKPKPVLRVLEQNILNYFSLHGFNPKAHVWGVDQDGALAWQAQRKIGRPCTGRTQHTLAVFRLSTSLGCLSCFIFVTLCFTVISQYTLFGHFFFKSISLWRGTCRWAERGYLYSEDGNAGWWTRKNSLLITFFGSSHTSHPLGQTSSRHLGRALVTPGRNK